MSTLNSSSTVESTSALFYPFIHFRSRRWLRTAMLYYDDVSRIVPPGFDPDELHFYADFSRNPVRLMEEVRQLRAAGFVKDEAPNEIVAQIADEFFDFVMQNLADPVRRAQIFPRLSSRRFLSIHPEKIDLELFKILQELELAHKKQNDPYSDWHLEPVTGGLYMLFLADRMAGKRHLVSDNSIYQSLLYSPVSQPEHEPKHTESEFRLATAVFNTLVPDGLEWLDLDVLLRLREDCSSQRRRFQDQLSRCRKDLQAAKNEDDLQDVIAANTRAIQDEYETLRDKFMGLNLFFGQALFSVSVPSYLTSPWGLGVTAHSAIFAAGAVAISGLVMKHVIDRRIASRSSGATYLINVKRTLSAEMLAQNIITLNLEAPDDDDDDRRLACAGV